MTSPADVQTPNFLGNALRRNAIIILVLAVLGGAAAYQYAASRPDQFESRVRVLLNPTSGNPYSPESGQSGQQVTIAMTTEAEIVDSAAVAAIANDKLADDWVPGTATVGTSVPPNTQMVAISFRAPSAEAARQGAQVVAEAFLEYRKTQSLNSQKARLDTVKKQATTVQSALDKASKAAAGENPSPEAVQQVQLYASELASLQRTIGDLESLGSDPGQIVAAATLPTAPTGLNPRIVGAAGALAGLVFGLLLALLRQRTDKRIHGAQTARVGGVPVIAGAPRHGVFAALRKPTTDEVDAVNRLLRTSILAALPAPSALGVSPVSDRVNGSVLTLEVAQLIAQSGYTVTVIDATPDGELSRVTGLEGRDGLAQVLRSNAASVMTSTQIVGNVRVLPAGGDLAQSQELLAGQRFAATVAAALEDSDYVVVATGHASTPTAMGVARVVGHLVLVGEDVRTTITDVEEAAMRAQQVRVGILGVALMPHGTWFGRRRAERTASAPVSPAAAPAPQPPAGAGATTGSGPQATSPSDGRGPAAGVQSSGESGEPVASESR